MAKRLGGLGKGLNAIFIENDNEENNGTVSLKISEIEPNRSQPRKEFDEEALNELAESISKHGLLQPILVRPLTLGGYEIVAGERRYRASRMAGLTEVPVIIRELSESETMELALIENLQREDLSPLEEALGYSVLMDEHGFTQEEVARSVGKSRPAVANALRLLKLPESVRELLRDGTLTAEGKSAALRVMRKYGILTRLASVGHVGPAFVIPEQLLDEERAMARRRVLDVAVEGEIVVPVDRYDLAVVAGTEEMVAFCGHHLNGSSARGLCGH